QMEKEEETREILLPNWGSGSHGITIDQTDDGVFVKRVQQNSPAAMMGVVKEGDQIVSATVYFDNLQSGEVTQLLNSMGHHTVGLRLQRRGDKSPLPGQSWSQDVFTGSSPEVVLSGDDEEYRRIYTTKIKPRLKSEEGLGVEGGGTQSRTITVTRKVTAYTVDVTRRDGAQDGGGLGPEWKVSSQEMKLQVDPTLPQNQVPGGETGRSLGVEMVGPSATFAGSSSKVATNGQMGNLEVGSHLQGPRLDGKGHVSPAGTSIPCLGDLQAPGVDVPLPGMDHPSPDVGKVKIPVMKMPKFGFPGMEPQPPQVATNLPTPKLPSPGLDITSSSLQVTGPEVSSPSVQVPKVQVGLKGVGQVPSPGLEVPGVTIKGPSVELPASGVDKGKIQIPSMTLPKFTTSDSQGEGPVVEMMSPKGEVGLGGGTPKVAIKGEWKGPTFKKVETPQISLSDVNLHLKGPQVKGDLEGDVQGLGSKGLKVDLKAPEVAFESPEVYLKGPRGSAPELDLNVKGPKLEGEVSLPKMGVDLKGPQLDLKGPQVGLDMPDIDLQGPKVDL
ncbi:AHNK protein, partial [Hemiprocne comata]|nr:AHNK protein [Hemiprocne comata]